MQVQNHRLANTSNYSVILCTEETRPLMSNILRIRNGEYCPNLEQTIIHATHKNRHNNPRVKEYLQVLSTAARMENDLLGKGKTYDQLVSCGIVRGRCINMLVEAINSVNQEKENQSKIKAFIKKYSPIKIIY